MSFVKVSTTPNSVSQRATNLSQSFNIGVVFPQKIWDFTAEIIYSTHEDGQISIQ